MAGDRKKRPRSRFRRWVWAAVKRTFKVVVVCSVLALVLVFGAAAWARTPMAREYAGREAAAALKRELGLIASIDEVDVDLDRLAVVARGIRLDHPEHGRFADAAELRIRPSWWAIMRGSIDLHAITIERATLWLKIRDQQILNLPELPDRQSDGDELELPFHWFIVKQSRLVVDASPVANGELANIDIQLNATNENVLRISVHSPRGFVNHATGSDTLTRLEVVGGLRRDQLELDLLRFETPDVALGVSGARARLPLGQEEYTGRATLSIDLAQLGRWPHGLSLPPLSGQLTLDAKISGEGDKPTGRGSLTLKHGVIDGYTLAETVVLKGAFDGQTLSYVGSADLIRKGGRVDLAGSLGFGEGLPLQVHANIHDVSFAKLMEQLDVSPNAIVDWTLGGTWDLKGTLDPLALTGPMRMPTRDFRVTQDAWHVQPARRILGVGSARLDGTVAIRDEGLYLDNVDIQLPSSRLKASVLLGFDNQLRARGEGVDWSLADSSPLLQFQTGGRGRFEVQIDGTFMDPVVKGHATVADFAFNSFVFGNIDTDFALDADMMGVRFPRIETSKRDSRYAVVDAFLDFRDDAFAAGGNVEIERMLLRDFYHVFHYENDERYTPYRGVVAGKARVDYTMDHEGDGPNGTMIADIEVDVPEAELNGYGFTDGRFAGRWTWFDHTQGYRGGELTVDRFSLHKGRGTVNVSGKMARGGMLDVIAVGDRIAIRDTEGMRDRLAGVSGSYAVTANVKGTAAIPRVDIDLVGTGLSFRGEQLGDGRAYVRLTDKSDPWVGEALRWKAGEPPANEKCGHAREGLARGVWDPDPPLQTSDGLQPALETPMAWLVCGQLLDGKIEVDMAVGRTEAMPLRGRLGAVGLRLGKFLPRNPKQSPMRGLLDGAVRFTGGDMKAPFTLAGRAVFDTVRVGQLDVELMNSGPVDVSFGRGGFRIASAEFIGPSSQLYIRGGGSALSGFALNVDGNIDLGLIGDFSRTVTEAMGTVALSFKVSGPIPRPQVYGHAALRGGAVALSSFPEGIKNVNGNVTFSAHRVLFEDFSGSVAGGTVSWAGTATLAGQNIGAYNFAIEANGIDVAPRDGVELTLGGRADLGWKEGDRLPLLSGRLRIDDLEYTRPINIGRTLEDMYQSQRTDIESYDPDADMVALDLRVEQSQPFHIRNNLIDAELALQTDKRPFRMVGTDQRFGVTGNMSVKKGEVHFRDTTFDIRQGDISFDDETRIDPLFDLRATTEVRRSRDQSDWHIQMHAYGHRDEFQFELTSDPYLTEDDIALLLTLGMTHSELAQLETGDLTSTAALEALATVTGVEREVHRALPQIDDIHIASSYSELSNRTEPQLFIGKRIADNVRLSASTGIAESRDFSTGVELQLNDQTSVEAVYNNQNSASTSQVGDVGVDLKWRLEFD